jgi:hypothetical protein
VGTEGDACQGCWALAGLNLCMLGRNFWAQVWTLALCAPGAGAGALALKDDSGLLLSIVYS